MDILNQKVISNNFDICIYHNKCPDGMAAFWCIKKWGANKNIIGLPMYHTNTPDEDLLKNKRVILVDICLDEEKMSCILEYCTDVVVVDHHIASYELLQNLIKRDEPRFELIYYEDKSACQIMWNILSPIKAKGEPSFIKFIGMRDLGEGWGERAHNFCLGWKDKFNTITYDSIDILYDSLIKRTKLIEKMINKGKEIFNNTLEKYDNLDEKKGTFIPCFTNNDLKYRIRICEGNRLDKSDFAIYLCKKYKDIDFAVIWSEIKTNSDKNANKKHKVSMRSIKDNINLIPIAKSFGGGGHVKACGIANINIYDTFYKHTESAQRLASDELTIEDVQSEITDINPTGKQWYRIGFIVVIFGVLYFIVKK